MWLTLSDGVSYLLLSDGVSRLLLSGVTEPTEQMGGHGLPRRRERLPAVDDDEALILLLI
jgi:hypothetical protein